MTTSFPMQPAGMIASIDFFSGFDEGQRFVLFIVAIGCSTGIIISLGTLIVSLAKRIHHQQTTVQLKQDLLDRGLSADEVVAIVNAGEPDPKATEDEKW